MTLQYATVKNIAERAQVSTATVSRILNGKGGHRTATAESVLRIAAELEREAEAAGKVRNMAENIGVILPVYRDFLNTSYNSTLMTAIVETLAAEGYLVQLLTRTPTRMQFDFFRDAIAGYRIKGIIIPEFDTLYAISKELNHLEIPVISIGNLNGAEMHYNIHVDDFATGYDSATYLWSLGHRHFAFLSMSLRDISQRQRLAGFQQALLELSGSNQGIWCREFPNLADSTTLAALEFSRLSPRPTVCFSTNSFMTQKFMTDLHALGIRIPEQLAVISYEENGELEYFSPPITTIAQPTRELGCLAATMLLKTLRGFNVEARRCLRCSLNIRESTPPRSAVKTIKQDPIL